MKILANEITEYEGEVTRNFAIDDVLYIPQFTSLCGTEMVRQTLAMYGEPCLEDIDPPSEVFNRLRLHMDNRVSTLSGGERKTLALSRLALSSKNFKCILLDEPTTGMDTKSAYEILDWMRHVAEKNRVVIIVVVHHYEQLGDLLSSNPIQLSLFEREGERSRSSCCYKSEGGSICLLFQRFFRLRFIPNPIASAFAILTDVMIVVIIGVCYRNGENNNFMGIWLLNTWAPFIGTFRAISTIVSLRNVLVYERSTKMYSTIEFSCAWISYHLLNDFIPYCVHVIMLLGILQYDTWTRAPRFILFGVQVYFIELNLGVSISAALGYEAALAGSMTTAILAFWMLSGGGFVPLMNSSEWVIQSQWVNPMSYLANSIKGEEEFWRDFAILSGMCVFSYIVCFLMMRFRGANVKEI